MVEESILIEKPARETASLVKDVISEIYGKVTKEETRRIYWEYEIGVHTIKCESRIEPEAGHTVITTSAHSRTRKSSSKQVIDKFHNALSENAEIRKAERSQSAPDKEKFEPKESSASCITRSITPKHIVIGSITLIAGALSFYKFRKR